MQRAKFDLSLLGWVIVVLAIVLPATPWAAGYFAQPPVRIPSNVVWTPETIAQASNGNPVRGLIIGKRCTRCHGDEGFSDRPLTPNLAGMNVLAIWKQLQDFRSGKRVNSTMQGMVADRTDADIADIAAYFSMQLTTPDPLIKGPYPGARPTDAEIDTASRLVTLGDGTRGIPPCQACHGPAAFVQGAPSLATQNGEYIQLQLAAFSESTRTNDINERMRTIASQMTPAERDAVAKYYGAGFGVLPATTVKTK